MKKIYPLSTLRNVLMKPRKKTLLNILHYSQSLGQIRVGKRIETVSKN